MVRVLLIREVAVVTTPGVTSTRIVTSPETGHRHQVVDGLTWRDKSLAPTGAQGMLTCTFTLYVCIFCLCVCLKVVLMWS